MALQDYLTKAHQSQISHMKQLLIITTILIILTACSAPVKRATLRDIDIVSNKKTQPKVFIKPRTDDEIRQAYADYLKFASKNDNSRIAAINRLAEIEFELGEKQAKNNAGPNSEHQEKLEDALYNTNLDKTIELLTTSLKDYPKFKGNDKVLYQLSKAYEQRGDNKNSKKTLSKLVNGYPKSQHYIESQFRLAEMAFSHKDYVLAEDTYTDIIGSKKNNIFYEKALYKRGWARFKQEYYLEAADDYLESITFHNFPEYSELDKSELDQFNEYFRAIGLTFSYLGGAEPLNEYFKSNSDFKFIYHTYSHVSDIYLKQHRYSDAVNTLEYFVKHHPRSTNIPQSRLNIIAIWKEGGFVKRAYSAIDSYYNDYNPDSKYWLSTGANGTVYKQVTSTLKDDILLVASYFHRQHQLSNKKKDFSNAQKWYKRYLKHYSSYARKNNVYYQYAELLHEGKHYTQALHYYELAAYDTKIILNKNAAYATILLTNRLYARKKSSKEKVRLLEKYLSYTTLFSQLYPNSQRGIKAVLHATELAYTSKQYNKAIELANEISNLPDTKSVLNANIIKAHSFFKLEKYAEAEENYKSLLQSNYLNTKTKANITDKLALSIYKQAESYKSDNQIQLAVAHFLRIAETVPTSTIAATGMYDAIALTMANKMWVESINNIKRFQKLYPRHKLSSNVTKKLSIAYLNSNQGIMAAKEFEKISLLDKNKDVQIAALWQAAELYEKKTEIPSAIRTYKELSTKYRRPYPQYIEAMNKLSKLYGQQNNTRKKSYWQKKILSADKRAPRKLRTERTKLLVSLTSLTLAKGKEREFEKQKLILPLRISLRKKKNAMQSAVKFYGQASIYGIPEITTQATYSIAEIYRIFSMELLESERPKNLNQDELQQYEILLEDRAFPFEEKAIEFFETNLSHTKEGVNNDWLKLSHSRLKELFPVRYKRKAKVDAYVNVLH